MLPRTYHDDRARLRVALCQIDTRGRRPRRERRAAVTEALRWAERGRGRRRRVPGAGDLGYPPEDLLLKPGFVADNQRAARAGRRGRPVDAWRSSASSSVDRDAPYNAAAVLRGGKVRGVYRKQALPNYAVFDEKRYFDPGRRSQPRCTWSAASRSASRCARTCGTRPARSPPRPTAVPSCPQHQRLTVRMRPSRWAASAMLADRAADSVVPIVYVNQVGGQDDLVFDGGSVVVRRRRRASPVRRSSSRTSWSWTSTSIRSTERQLDPGAPGRRPVAGRGRLPRRGGGHRRARRRAVSTAVRVTDRGAVDRDAEVCPALVLGTRDYVVKNGFSDVVIGLSGGRRLHARRRPSPSMPSAPTTCTACRCRRATPATTRVGRRALLAENLGIDYRTIAIEPAHVALLEMLTPSFEGPSRTSPRRTCRAASGA